MANPLDETHGPINQQGRDVNVIDKKIPVKTGGAEIAFQVFLWFPLIIPGIIYIFVKQKRKSYLQQLEQKIQAAASQIDNYLEQRIQILEGTASLVSKSIELDKDVMKSVAALRGGVTRGDDTKRSEIAGKIETASSSLFNGLRVQLERYPELKAHDAIRDAMQKNAYLQKEITAAREVYNDAVLQWNTEIFQFPTNKIVAAKEGYTTRIPFIASREVKEQARKNFFEQ